MPKTATLTAQSKQKIAWKPVKFSAVRIIGLDINSAIGFTIRCGPIQNDTWRLHGYLRENETKRTFWMFSNGSSKCAMIRRVRCQQMTFSRLLSCLQLTWIVCEHDRDSHDWTQSDRMPSSGPHIYGTTFWQHLTPPDGNVVLMEKYLYKNQNHNTNCVSICVHCTFIHKQSVTVQHIYRYRHMQD